MTARHDATAELPIWSKPRNRWIGFGGATAILCLWSVFAQAQINPFKGYNGPVLTKADLDQGMQAANRLLNTDAAEVGASETWTGPTSGNRGTLTVQNAFERHGTTCRSLRAVVNYKAGAKRTWTLNVCHQPNGEWKLV
jgi:surface antigen